MAEGRAKIKPVQVNHLDDLFKWPNVTAVDINYRTKGGKKTDQLCLVIWVKKKRPESGIPAEEVLPREIDGVSVDVFEGEATLGEGFQWPNIPANTQDNSPEVEEVLPREIDGVPVDVFAEEATLGEGFQRPNIPANTQDNSPEFLVAESAAENLLKLRPLDTLRGGDSLGYATSDKAGTLGYFVTKKNAVGVLSNFHVMGAVGNKLLSPAKKDRGTNNDYIGTVKNTALTKTVDCGYAPLRGRITKFNLTDGTTVMGTEAAEVGTFIKFCGRTSSGLVGRGVVQSVDWAGLVAGMRFENQIMISVPAQPGDSGSLLVNRKNNRAIGLIFADCGGHGLANQIQDVLEALDVQIAIERKLLLTLKS